MKTKQWTDGGHTRDHLDADALLDALVDGGLGVVAWRVEERQQAQHDPVVAILPGFRVYQPCLDFASFTDLTSY